MGARAHPKVYKSTPLVLIKLVSMLVSVFVAELLSEFVSKLVS